MAKSEEAKARKMGAKSDKKIPGVGVPGGTNRKTMVVGRTRPDGTWSGMAWWKEGKS